MAGQSSRVKIWDSPTRLFHWMLVVLIGLMWWSGEQRMLDWHRLGGYAIITLLLFRWSWGIVGSTTSRFSALAATPGQVLSYLRHSVRHRGKASSLGHNPAGGWSAIIMLLLLTAQAGLGLISVDVDGIESGPFAYLVEFETGRWAAGLHGALFNILLGIIALHIAAVVFYLIYHRENLIGAMITGSRKRLGDRPEPNFASAWRGAFVLAVSGGLVWGSIYLFGRA